MKSRFKQKKNQDKFISETKVLINKFRAKKNKAAFAQTLITKLERLEIIHVEKEDVGSMQFRFPPAPHSGKLSLEINDVSKSYNDLKVLSNIDLQVIKGDKLAFVGKNGEGKSTLAKMIVRDIEFEGEIKLGHQIKIGYYAQNQADFLDENLTVLETIENAVTEHTKSNVRTILGSFLFSNDDVSKKVKVLSGGERARVALCKLLLEPYNLLVMDEPTNHLDINSKALLKKALLNYDGSLIVVSHDREFLQGLTQKVYEFKQQNIKEYIGDIDTFLTEKDIENFKQLETSQKAQKVSTKNKEEEQLSYKDSKEKKSNIKRLKNSIGKLEKQIEQIENLLKQKDAELSDPEKFKILSNDKEFFAIYNQEQTTLKEIEKDWERKTEELDSLL